MKRRLAYVSIALLITALAPPGSAQAAGMFAPTDSATIDKATATALKEPIDALTKDVERMHPVAMFFLAKRLNDAGRNDEALFWFYEGQLRWRSHIRKNKDVMEQAVFDRLFSDIGPDINRYGGRHIPIWLKTIDDALAWDAQHPDDFTPAGPEKDVTRKGLVDLKSMIVNRRDEFEKKNAEEDRQAVPASADDPYPGDGGAMFGTPQEMVGAYDPSLFKNFKPGATTKSDVVKALGKPEMWFSETDGTSTLSYPYHRSAAGLQMLGMSQRVSVSFKFDAKKILTDIKLPQDKTP